ncbi:hypothetical protein VST7929_00440 [Vibrio stylophorae]|uniref:UPF0301 protein VST7929_00440 n=1 Tax=Vibrio stylophorae TaxID=659351 RepID=A0ABM8ZR94_9VIBR|nr:YqgE/AlgH family protein [Vibrio stylophorae]CAH0532601.1 hypothetical protein VST7929_00440 [Vibrio stylophorae]
MNLKNHFLVAMPTMEDPNFQRSVVFICEHNESGAMGIAINQPINITVGAMLEQIEVASQDRHGNPKGLEQPVLNGGPVAEDRGFVLHSSLENSREYGTSLKVSEQVSITTSTDILSQLGSMNEPDKYMIALGYSGWEAGQLEQELAENAWLTLEASPEVLFDIPVSKRWQAAIAQLGIDIANLSSDVGHA